MCKVHIRRKTILGLFIACAFLLGSFITPVEALQANIVEESFNYAFAPGENNHTYVYVPSDDPFMQSSSSMYLNEDVDLTSYIYENSGWNSPDTSYSEDSSVYFDWQQFNALTSGVYGNSPYLPDFYDFIGSDGSGAIINTTIERRSFSLSFGQTTPVVMDVDYTYYGTLVISGQEFVHLTITSQADDILWIVAVYDPEGRYMAGTSSTGGDIKVIPFLPSTAGTYFVILYAVSGGENYALFNLKPEAVTPTTITSGQVITGNLPTAEYVIVDGSGYYVYDEQRPTVTTYKINPKDDVSSLTYAFNYPEDPPGFSQPVSIIFTSDAFVHGTDLGYRYSATISSPGTDVYYCRGDVYYITIMGGDNTDYTLYHEADVATVLPINHEFRIDNIFGHTESMIYSLIIEEDSVLKVNSTVPSDFTITAWSTSEDGYLSTLSIVDGTTLDASSSYYLLPGEYVVIVDVSAHVSESIEFSLGTLTTASSASIINVGGFFVPTDPCEMYNLTITLNNNYNVSVPMGIYIYDQFYKTIASTSLTLGTWSDGSGQIPHATQESEIEFTITSPTWSTDHAVILIATYPYNNTAGIGDYFENFNVSLTIDWEKVTADQFANHDSIVPTIDVSTSSHGYNLTLDFPGSATEYYLVILNVTPGTWYNISIMTGDVTSLQSIEGYSPYYESTYYIPWGDFNDALQGSVPDWSVQFGAISSKISLIIRVNRVLSDTGFLWIEATPLETHTLEGISPLEAPGPDILAILGGIAVPLGITAVAIVVIVVVYVKKFKK